MKAGRVGDEARCLEDGHACPACKHVTAGPSKKGSPDVFINNQPVLRVGDPGEHTETCCGKNKWRAKTGSSTVTINGLPIHRVGDATEHCGGVGKLITGSSNVDVGSGGVGARVFEPEKALTIQVTDAFDRALQGVKARVLSPDGEMKEVVFDGVTSLSGLHKGSSVLVEKTLQRSKADRGAVKGVVPSGTRLVTPPKKQANPALMAMAAAKPKGATSDPNTGGVQAPSDEELAEDPASNGTSKDPGTTTVPGTTGGTVKLVKLTVHNWVQAVYRAFKIKFPTKPWQTATLAVREASMLNANVKSEDAVVRAERLAAQGKTSAKGGSKKAKQNRASRKQSVAMNATRYDDTLYIVWTQSKASKSQKVEVFQCTVDPGITASSYGQPYLLEGHEYQLHNTLHLSHKYGNQAYAYRILDKGRGAVTLVRTHDKRYINSTDDRSGPVLWTNMDAAINMHFGGSAAGLVAETVGGWSAGCTVLRHGLWSKRYRRFVEITQKSKDTPRPYLVVSSKYIRLFHEWVAYCKGDPKKAKDPKSILKMGELKDREIKGRYIPSLLDVTYAKKNPSTVKPMLFTVAKKK
jgi:uncharacterized Zn-binding protein involved in type VI secretion